MNRNLSAVAAALLACAVLPAAAVSELVPAQPSAFEPIHLRMTVDSCTFAPGTVHVSAASGVLRMTQQLRACLVAGTPEVVDVRLGALPAGEWRIEVFASPDGRGTPVESIAFTVSERAEVAVFPPPPRPLAEYTGLWWSPAEGGWGLSLHQGPGNALFGSWFVYGATGQPEWFTLQGGQWTSHTRWAGTIYRNTGPSFAGPGYDPRLVLVQPAGTAVLDFSQAPGRVGEARFSYTLNGAPTGTKALVRFPL